MERSSFSSEHEIAVEGNPGTIVDADEQNLGRMPLRRKF